MFLIDVGRKDEAVTVIRGYVEGVPETQEEFCVLKRLIEDTTSTTHHRQNIGDMVCEVIIVLINVYYIVSNFSTLL